MDETSDLPHDLSLLEEYDANEVTGMNTELPTLYAVKQKATADAWAAVQNKLRDGYIESSPHK